MATYFRIPNTGMADYSTAPKTGYYACSVDVDGDVICNFTGIGYFGPIVNGHRIQPVVTGFVEHWFNKGETFSSEE